MDDDSNTIEVNRWIERAAFKQALADGAYMPLKTLANDREQREVKEESQPYEAAGFGPDESTGDRPYK